MKVVIPERNYILASSATAFIVGIYMADYLQSGLYLLVICVLALVCGFCLYKAEKSPRKAILLFILCLGMMRSHGVMPQVFPETGQYDISGYVMGIPKEKENNRITFTLCDVTLNETAQASRAYCTLTYQDHKPSLFDGAKISGKGFVYQARGKTGPSHFDFRTWLFQNDMHYGISITKPIEVHNTPETAEYKDITSHIQQFANRCFSRVMGENAPVATAMLFGSKENMAEDDIQAFRDLGIAHVLSVSGLHVGLLGGVILWIMACLRVPRKIKFWVLAIWLFAYGTATGFSPATLRASITLLYWEGAQYYGKSVDPPTMLSFTMATVLAISPWERHSVGFVLSFTATAGIMLLYPPLISLVYRIIPKRKVQPSHLSKLQKIWRSIQRFLGGFREVLCISLAAQIGVSLPVAYYFHTFPVYSIIVNLVVVPYVTLLMSVYLLTFVTNFIPYVSVFTGWMASGLTDGLLEMVNLFATLPHASITVSKPEWIAMVGVFVLCLLCSRWIQTNLASRLLTITLCLAIIGSSLLISYQDSRAVRYIQFSVGQADSAILIDGDYTIAIDTGEDAQALLDYVQDTGRAIDALFITHLHYDHVGGVTNLLEAKIPIKKVYVPVGVTEQEVSEVCLEQMEKLKENHIALTYLSAGDQIAFDQTKVTVCWPIEGKIRQKHNPNDYSFVLDIDMAGYHLLQNGDITGNYEAYAARPCDVLKVAHHGSGTSTSQSYLDFVQPQLALLTCSGYSELLPNKATLQRLEEEKIPLYRTDIHGDVSFTVKKGELIITPYIKGATDEYE